MDILTYYGHVIDISRKLNTNDEFDLVVSQIKLYVQKYLCCQEDNTNYFWYDYRVSVANLFTVLYSLQQIYFTMLTKHLYLNG